MTSDITKQLARLSSRRHGGNKLDHISQDERTIIVNKSLQRESWQNKAAGKPYTRYAIGAMQEVDPDYTRISIETAKRVENQLRKKLFDANLFVEFRLQGSVPLNVHIRGISDVDLLTLDTSFLVYTNNGKKALGSYYTTSSKNSVGVLSKLRSEIEISLKTAFYAATVDTSHDKAVKIFGGSLPRPVDVVPAHWWDTYEYQASGQEYDRGVIILNKSKNSTIENLPFLHIKRITDCCDQTLGCIRKSIRLCKNVKADAEEEGTKIELSSFDIASMMYHANKSALSLGYVYELQILAETQRFLDQITRDHSYAKTLKTPDGSRIIFDEPAKLSALNKLSIEMDNLLLAVANEQRSLATPYSFAPTLETARSSLQSILIS